MRKVILITSLILLVTGFSSFARGDVYTFRPDPPDMHDLLGHEGYVTWGIDWYTFDSSIITGASITFHNIDNSAPAGENVFYVSLLQQATQGLYQLMEPGDGTGNIFTPGPNVANLGEWSDPNGFSWGLSGDNVTFSISSEIGRAHV